MAFCYVSKVLKKLDGNGEPIRGEGGDYSRKSRHRAPHLLGVRIGKSRKAIAGDLNRESIPGPLGRAWGDTSIRGYRSRGTGILNNELYSGVLVWNGLRFVKDPSTGSVFRARTRKAPGS